MLKYLKKSIVPIIIFLTFINSSLKAEMKNLNWFTNFDCNQLNILKFKSQSDEKLIADIVIKDKATITLLMDQIKSLPVVGDEKVSFSGKAKLTKLIFKCSGDIFQNVQIVGSKFKTPSTGFISTKNAIEDDLVRDIDALAEPNLNKRILKIKDHQITFKDFTIMFKEHVHTPQPEDGPTVGPTNINHFSVWEKNSTNEVSIAIFDGQIPPQPQGFAVGKKIYYLLTYQNLDHESLYPKHFEISDKIPKRR